MKAELHQAESEFNHNIAKFNKDFAEIFDGIKPRRLAIREFTKIFITEGELNRIISRMELFWQEKVDAYLSLDEEGKCGSAVDDLNGVVAES